MSVNIKEKILKLINQKCIADGSILRKIEEFSLQGVERYFTKDGQKIAGIIARLNLFKNNRNWLSMKPNPQPLNPYRTEFGEVDNRLHYKGIEFYFDYDRY